MIESLQTGAHLTTQRAGYVHHGIYAGDGRVLQYGGYSRIGRRAPVEEVTLEQFAGGREVLVLSDEPACSPDHTQPGRRCRMTEWLPMLRADRMTSFQMQQRCFPGQGILLGRDRLQTPGKRAGVARR